MSKDVDVTNKINFISQFNSVFGDKKAQNKACCRACKKMLTDKNYKVVNGEGRVDTLVWDSKKNLVKAESFQDSIDLLNKLLDEGKPVIVGINRQKDDVGNVNECTSHFIVIVGRKYNSAIGGYEFRFYDPGTSFPFKGTHESNVLVIDKKTGFFTGKTFYNTKLTYILTEVRPTSI